MRQYACALSLRLQALHVIRALHQAVLSAEPYEPAPSPSLSKAGAMGSMPRTTSNGGLTGTTAVGGHRPSHLPSSSRESLDFGGGAADGSATAGVARSTTGHGKGYRVSSRSWGALLRLCSSRPPPLPRFARLGMADGPDMEPPTYLIELVEESGPALLRATYWDFGEWSDMWRQYKEVPYDVTFEVCMGPDWGADRR